MKKLFILLTFYTIQLQAQIRVNVLENNQKPEAILQIDNNPNQTPKGVLLPRIQLTDKYDFTPFETEPKTGLIVFNTLKSLDFQVGVYSWTGDMWELSSNNNIKEYIEQQVDTKFLGYTPKREVPSRLRVGNEFSISLVNGGTASAKLLKCITWEIPNIGSDFGPLLKNTYCIYNVSSSAGTESDLSTNLTWFDAFQFAKQQEGHLLTVTDDREWDFVKKNVLNQEVVGDAAVNKKSWLGSIRINDRYVGTVSAPSNNRDRMKFVWVTNENSVSIWTDPQRILQTHYEAGYPSIDMNTPLNISNTADNNNDITNYAAYITSTQVNSERQWRVMNSEGVNTKIRSYLNNNREVELSPTNIDNGNTDDFKSVNIIVEYTNFNESNLVNTP
ncbi:C-type lectin domain-containing protein [Faecalibacter bovis]|uniref:C-type lectin domain-containing protein n=1 Tax=Faecalibacter bovis TaxID=2898187 RepID=A0ABX7XE71_9FLAO|nr:C-type lectin domain-containing protein [Faecalibacter bovis]QTV06226.1 C-type lectin domain-containing protein [Faecalibacter bovis]